MVRNKSRMTESVTSGHTIQGKAQIQHYSWNPSAWITACVHGSLMKCGSSPQPAEKWSKGAALLPPKTSDCLRKAPPEQVADYCKNRLRSTEPQGQTNSPIQALAALLSLPINKLTISIFKVTVKHRAGKNLMVKDLQHIRVWITLFVSSKNLIYKYYLLLWCA